MTTFLHWTMGQKGEVVMQRLLTMSMVGMKLMMNLWQKQNEFDEMIGNLRCLAEE